MFDVSAPDPDEYAALVPALRRIPLSKFYLVPVVHAECVDDFATHVLDVMKRRAVYVVVLPEELWGKWLDWDAFARAWREIEPLHEAGVQHIVAEAHYWERCGLPSSGDPLCQPMPTQYANGSADETVTWLRVAGWPLLAAALVHINKHRARTCAQKPLQPFVAGWAAKDVVIEARRLGWEG